MGASGTRGWPYISGYCAVIFVTVGTDGPFDRLISAVDRWAGEVGRTDVVAQVHRSKLRPRFLRAVEFMEPPEFHRDLAAADLVVAHAGMGTILSALRFQKPLLVVPRRASLGEQRNEHQLATARRLEAMGKVSVAYDEDELLRRLSESDKLAPAASTTGPFAESRLLDALRAFIQI